MANQREQFTFRDVDSEDEVFAAVRRVPNGVGIFLSLREDGDIEVFLSSDDARRLADAVLRIASSTG
jgi:hypothetical protein